MLRLFLEFHKFIWRYQKRYGISLFCIAFLLIPHAIRSYMSRICVTSNAYQSPTRNVQILELCSGRSIFDHPQRVIWSFWDTENALPPFIAEIMHSWSLWNPNHNIVLLTSENLNCFLPDNTYEFLKHLPALRSDLIRLSVLELYGGVWLDSTVVLTQPLDLGPLPKSYEGIYSQHYSNEHRDFPESWYIRAAKGSATVSRWRVLLQAVVQAHGPKLEGLSSTFIYTPQSTLAYAAIQRRIGETARYWQEYLVVYVAYTYLYYTNVAFRTDVLDSNSFASEQVGYLAQWEMDWNMSKVNAILAAKCCRHPLHARLSASKLIKLSTSNLHVGGFDLASVDASSFLGRSLKWSSNDASLNRSYFRLVIVKYREDIGWSDRYRGLRVVYNKHPTQLVLPFDEVHEIPNTGTEHSGFLRYIISNYDNLPKFVAFSQGAIENDHSWIRKDWGPRMFINMLAEANANGCSAHHSASENDINFGLEFNAQQPPDLRYAKNSTAKYDFPDLMSWYAFHNWVPKGRIKIFPSSYVVVSRYNIRTRSKSYYRSLLKLIDYSIDPPEGHYMERSWFYIFNCK
jgi:hypothetical protein